MFKEEDWDALYYALVSRTDDRYKILSAEPSKLLAKNEGVFSLTGEHLNATSSFQRIMRAVAMCDIDNFVTIRTDQKTQFGLVYCEAKVYIYGKRWGFKGMAVGLDPNYEDDLLRYLNYTKVKSNGRR